MGVNAAVAGFSGGFNRRTVVSDVDEYLVARLRAGDDAAFEAIYDRYARGVLAFCVHMLGNREAAEDVLQLTFVSAFRALRGSDANVSLRPWLYTIARNRCLSELRARRDLDLDEVATDRPSTEGVADQVQRREDFREMLDDLQRLPADQRAALVLFELGDHSHEEIAAVLGVRKEKIKALVFQAREALVRGRRAREHPCAEIRERLATTHGSALPRSVARAHIDRCPGCAAFEREIRRQRAALALILPVVLTGELKALVLRSALHGAGPVAAGGATAAAGVGGAGAVAASGTTAAAGVGGAGAVVAGGTTAAGGMSGATAVAAGGSASVAGSVSAGTVAASTAVIAGAPSVVAVAGGVTGVGAEYAASLSAVGGVGGLGAAGLLGKVLTAAAIATAGAGAIHAGHSMEALPAPPAALVAQMSSSAPAAVAITASAPATALSPATAASASAGVTTTARVVSPSTTTTATTTIPAAPAATTATTTPASAASPSATATTTGTRDSARFCRRGPDHDSCCRVKRTRHPHNHRIRVPARFCRRGPDHDSRCRVKRNRRHRRTRSGLRRPFRRNDDSRRRGKRNRRHHGRRGTRRRAKHGQHRDGSAEQLIHQYAHHNGLGLRSEHGQHSHGDVRRSRPGRRNYRVRPSLVDRLARRPPRLPSGKRSASRSITGANHLAPSPVLRSESQTSNRRRHHGESPGAIPARAHRARGDGGRACDRRLRGSVSGAAAGQSGE